MSAPEPEAPDGGAQVRPSAMPPTPKFRPPPTFVLVPVPEEFVDDVAQLIMQAAFRETLVRWDEPAVTRLRAALDDRSWGLIAALAGARDPVGADDLGRELGIPPDEVGALRDQVTAACATIERLDVIAATDETPPRWAIRGMALGAVLAVLEEGPATS